MKLLLFIGLMLPLLCSAKTYQYGIFTGEVESSILSGRSLEIVELIYDDEEDHLVIAYIEGEFLSAVMLSEDSRSQLSGHIDKYIDWRDQANEREVELTKEIGKFAVVQHAWKGFGAASFSDPFEASVVFQSESQGVHNMVLSFPEVPANNFEYSSNRMNSIRLEFGGAMMLKSLLSERAIDEFLAEEKAIEDSFQ